ncbi:MAG: LysM peptidoglycan-binding domain-containing protein, partial [Crocinitomicaceae bacterium]|nr:LysM peptidoglycan-binding domain-containing protein [Crocinitomicaceae bacterium]
FLYDTFGDWQLALAAYNSGPGNVNKAIRRSGGKKDFWEIKNYLPRETQGYVPAFIAVNYVMNYATEHNIYPKKPLTTFFETDSVTVKDKVNFSVLSKIIDMPVDEIAYLNSTYKLKEIPKNGQHHYIILPVEKVGLFLANEGLVYEKCRERVEEIAPTLFASHSTDSSQEGGTKKVVWESTWKNHKVKRGETLGGIADKYNVSLAEIKKWNHVKGSVIRSGQTLKIKAKVKKTILVPEEENVAEKKEIHQEGEQIAEETNQKETATAEKASVTKENHDKTSYKFYTIQRGDTLLKIASKYDGVTVNSIKSLNNGLRENKLVVGQKIKIKQI